MWVTLLFFLFSQTSNLTIHSLMTYYWWEPIVEKIFIEIWNPWLRDWERLYIVRRVYRECSGLLDDALSSTIFVFFLQCWLSTFFGFETCWVMCLPCWLVFFIVCEYAYLYPSTFMFFIGTHSKLLKLFSTVLERSFEVWTSKHILISL